LRIVSRHTGQSISACNISEKRKVNSCQLIIPIIVLLIIDENQFLFRGSSRSKHEAVQVGHIHAGEFVVGAEIRTVKGRAIAHGHVDGGAIHAGAHGLAELLNIGGIGIHEAIFAAIGACIWLHDLFGRSAVIKMMRSDRRCLGRRHRCLRRVGTHATATRGAAGGPTTGSRRRGRRKTRGMTKEVVTGMVCLHFCYSFL